MTESKIPYCTFEENEQLQQRQTGERGNEGEREDSSQQGHSHQQQDPCRRSGLRLWQRARSQVDNVIIRAGFNAEELKATTHGGTEAEEQERLQRLTDETTQEIRQSMEFTMGQCLAAIIVYLLVGVLAYTLLLEPNWTFIDSLYFTVTTISTVGYGDLTPTTAWSRNFTAIFALGGVSCLGVVLGIVGSNLMDRQAHAMEATLHSNRANVMTVFSPPPSSVSFSSHVSEEAATTRSYTTRSSSMDTTTSSRTASHRLPEENENHDVCARLLIPIMTLLIGAIIMTNMDPTDEWTISKTLYYLVITAATIGYGDESPRSQMGRLFAVIYIPVAVMTMGEFLRVVAHVIMERKQRAFRESLKTNASFTLRDLEVMDTNGDGKVTRAEFLEFMLIAMNKVDKDLMIGLNEQFERLDCDGDGELELNDLVLAAKKRLHSTQRKLELAAYKHHLKKVAANSTQHRPQRQRQQQTQQQQYDEHDDAERLVDIQRQQRNTVLSSTLL